MPLPGRQPDHHRARPLILVRQVVDGSDSSAKQVNSKFSNDTALILYALYQQVRNNLSVRISISGDRLRSFMEMCILIPGSSLKHGAPPAQSRFPTGKGRFPNVWALRLVRGLLQWYPEDRMNVDVSLRHPYFQPPSQLLLSVEKSDVGTRLKGGRERFKFIVCTDIKGKQAAI